MNSESRISLEFSAPYTVKVSRESCPSPDENHVLIKSIYSAISAGTEMLAYRGELPDNMPLDSDIETLNENISYPLKYGYSLVGEVVAVGKNVATDWLGRRVFVFHPHESHFTTHIDHLIILPESLDSEDAVFLANMETAVSLVLDGRPIFGEKVMIVGSGVLGLLLASLLSRMPLEKLIAVDPIKKRRLAAIRMGVDQALEPSKMSGYLVDEEGFDMVYETSGRPEGLNTAVKYIGYKGRILIASWYGKKKVTLDLGSTFHRSKVSLYASQVSSIDPELRGRWNKKRRMSLAIRMLQLVKPSILITHQYDIYEAAQAYDILDQSNTEAIQVILTY